MGSSKHGPIDHDPATKARERTPEQQVTQAPSTQGVAAYMLHLQRTIGNQAVGQLLRQYSPHPSAQSSLGTGERSGRGSRTIAPTLSAPAVVQRVDAVGQSTLDGLTLTTDGLKTAAAEMGKGGKLTVAGHALSKHSVRTGSAFGPEVKGKDSVKNDAAAVIVAGIIDGADSTVTARKAGRYGDVIDIFVPGGRGVRFMQTGAFIGFLEP